MYWNNIQVAKENDRGKRVEELFEGEGKSKEKGGGIERV